MPLIRDITFSVKINALSFPAEVLFYRIAQKVDGFANFHANPLIIKSQCFPLKENVRIADVESWLKELTTPLEDSTGNETSTKSKPLVRIYTVDNKPFLHIYDFRQKLRWPKRLVPAPPREVEEEDELEIEVEGESKPARASGSKKEILKSELTKPHPHMFRDSEFFDIEKFKEKFAADKEYSKCDLIYYYNRVLNWSNGKNATRADWIATARNFMLGDASDGKLKVAGPATNGTSASQTMFPNYFDLKLAKTLSPEGFMKYQQHLRSLGWTPATKDLTVWEKK